MINITEDIQPLTTFRNNSVEMIKQLKKTGRPIILTVNGNATAVVQDAVSYQRLLDLAAGADIYEGIRQGREDISAGRTFPAEEVFAEIRAQYGIPD